jgi:amidohydrolase
MLCASCLTAQNAFKKWKASMRLQTNFWNGLLISSLFLATSAWAGEKEVLSAVDEANEHCRLVSQKLFGYKELGQQEFKSSVLLMDELASLGFRVTGNLKVPEDLVKGGVAKTAFRADLQGKGPGPTITILLEYDAMQNGHSCGHNLIAASGLLAAAGLAKQMFETPGRLLVIGTPDEERGSLGGGKIALLEGSHFDGTDVVLITHPAACWSLDQRLLAMKRATFAFKGKAAHASSAPDEGISALDAVVLTFNATDMLREHIRDDVRIHGIIRKGGDAVNIVPDAAEAEFAVRALSTATMEETYDRVVNCAKAGEIATGAELLFKEPRTELKSPIIVRPLLNLVRKGLNSMGVEDDEIMDGTDFGSSDRGNVGHEYPTVNLSFKIALEGTVGHTDAFREAAGSEEGWKAAVVAAKVMSLTAYNLLTHPEKVKKIQEKFALLKASDGI